MSPENASSGTRQRILAYLQEHHTASVSTLSRTWGLTRASIRYHLNDLIKDGSLELVPRDADKPSGRGRPSQTYRLATHSYPDNLAPLCHNLLIAFFSHLSEDEQQTALKQLAESIAGDFTAVENITRRFTQVVAHLNHFQYHARWEAHAQGPRILLRSCPYAAILAHHPELCQLDAYLIQHLLLAPVQQLAQMDLVSGNPPACVFVPIPK